MFGLKEWLAKQVADDRVCDWPASDVTNQVADSGREFIITNGLGSFASGDALSGANTRRYHGLFVAALQPPVRRTLVLSHLDERLTVAGGQSFELATNIWRGAVAPSGYKYVEQFTIYPSPTWVFALPGGHLVKQVAMVHGKQQVVIGYTWIAADGVSSAKLDLTCLVNNRDMHSETHGWDGWNFQQVVECGSVRIKGWDDAQELVLRFDRGAYQSKPGWYWRYQWPREAERGLNDGEDCFATGEFTTVLASGETLSIVAELAGQPEERVDRGIATIGDAVRRAWTRQQDLLAAAGQPTDSHVRQLVLAADQFLVHRDSVDGSSVIAGYHWFGDWGRDSMISLVGLTLASGRYEEAKSILRTFARYESEGMLPNFFPDSGQAPEYNTSDATFWWAWALHQYWRASGDFDFVLEQLPALEQVVEWHRKGTRHGLHLDQSDGLVSGGEAGTQLTWMDAKCGDFVVTPRQGKAVEICALWYNFLRCLALFYQESLKHDGTPSDAQVKANEYARMAEAAAKGMGKFWNAARGCLYDVILDDGREDASVRPNQLIALGLPYVAFSPEQARQALIVVEQELLTPMGLRTLSPSDPAYHGQYGDGQARADQYHRDVTYHQGTVWPWLMGPYVDARLYAHGNDAPNAVFALAKLDALMEHLMGDAGIGSVSEIFDGNAPHTARGCVAQAWSVAELLRVRKHLIALASSAPIAVATA